MLASVVMLLVVAAFGYDAKALGPALWQGAFGNAYRIAAVVVAACPLCILGLAVAVAFRTGAWNIGAEGQFLLGSAGAVFVGMSAGGAPGVLAIPLTIVAGIVGGAGWSLIAGGLRVGRGVQEVLSTILLNFVAVRLTEYLVRGPLVDPESIDRDSTSAIAESARLPVLWEEAGVHSGVIAAAAGAVVIHLLLWQTRAGFCLRAVGGNAVAAKYAGIETKRWTLLAFGISGGLAGLAGAIEICGTHHYLTTGFASGAGYTAIAVAMLARLNPLGVIPAAMFFAAIDVGVRSMQKVPVEGLQEFPTSMKFVAQGLVVLVTLLLTARKGVRR